jgi:uncharacterized RmlC-like cupin family protein
MTKKTDIVNKLAVLVVVLVGGFITYHFVAEGRQSNEKPAKTVQVVSVDKVTSMLGPQNQILFPTITQKITGATGIGAGFLVMPPARVAKPHYHKNSELVIFFLEGHGVAFTGPKFEPHYVGPGDFLYVPEGVAHFGINLSETERHVAVEVRTDPQFNEDVVLLPEMDAEANRLAAEYRRKFADGTLNTPAEWKGQPKGPYNFVQN